MANSLYTQARLALFRGDIDLEDDTIRAALVTSGYTPNLMTDEVFDDLGANVLDTPVELENKAVSADGADAIFDADDIEYDPIDETATYIVLYQDTGDPATSRLILLIDTASGLPVSPGLDSVPIAWAAAGIFSWLGC